MATKNNIAVLGCGWLGFPLAKNLMSYGSSVKGSTTSESKIQLLQSGGIDAYKILLTNNKVAGNIQGLLENSAVLIIDVPPKSATGENFAEKIRELIPYIVSSSITNVIFIGSTSVYPDNNSIAIEDVDLHPVSKSAMQLLEAEQILLHSPVFETTIIRFGGLIANDRHPVFHLSGQKNCANPEAPVNLIHRDDCIAIIHTIIKNNIWGHTINAVAPFHPTRKDFYTQKAIALQLPPPAFDTQNPSVGKQVSSGKLLRLTGYNFIHPQL